MGSRGQYDAVVDVDVEGEGDLGHTDLQEDLEFHSSNFEDPSSRNKSLPFTNQDTSSGGGGAFAGKRFLWSLGFYAQFFDVDTTTVLNRCAAALYPRRPFLDVLDGNPDLYGPFWIATTVVFILFLTGTISAYLAAEGDQHFEYDFGLLGSATGLIYGYTAIIPVALWAVLRWFGSEGANLLECWALYGYANLIWIPVACISWSPLTALNWAFTAVGFAASLVFLLRNFWPVINATEQKVSRILLIVIVALHIGLAFAIKIFFFSHGSIVHTPDKVGENQPVDGGDAKEGAEAMLRFFLRL